MSQDWGSEESTGEGTHHNSEQIIRKLARGEELLGQDKSIEDVCRLLGITESAWHRW